ncbi:TRAP transporter small permease subunit [Alkalihalobacillus oceani]|uniref:TRAP transporter small permease n=1 Tax=Halalkalibacter oceani TaxID=1653776 RepID=UPI00203FB16B|nr:TRAP transporter small permease subunit [Halalkalibacter oceani]MCM3759943.1 TRAP transporter small permease subunit [Halalkalibacter oceani]
MWIRYLSDKLDSLSRIITMVLLVIMFINVFGTAALRYVIGISFVGSYDFARIFFLWCTFFGACIVFKQKEHSRFEFFYIRTKGMVRKTIDVLCNLLYVGFFCMILVVGTRLTISISTQVLPASGVSAVWLYLPIVLAAFVMLVHVLNFLYTDFFSPRSNEESKSDIERLSKGMKA